MTVDGSFIAPLNQNDKHHNETLAGIGDSTPSLYQSGVGQIAGIGCLISAQFLGTLTLNRQFVYTVGLQSIF